MGFIDNTNLIYTWGKIKEYFSQRYVAKEDGKGLSTNDFTDAYETKLTGIEVGADANIIESISLNGVPQDVVGKNVDLIVSGGSSNSVLFTEQTLLESQKNQARVNIGAEKASQSVIYTSAEVAVGVDLGDNVDVSIDGSVGDFIINSIGEIGAIQFISNGSTSFTLPSNSGWAMEEPKFEFGKIYTLCYYKGSFLVDGGR